MFNYLIYRYHLLRLLRVIMRLIGHIACEMANLSLPIVVILLIYRSLVMMIKIWYFV